jgi:hypothetical protein
MENVEQLAIKFRDAIDLAKRNDEFANDVTFEKFPLGCCGDASDLLAQFLLENKIKTHYICGTRYGAFEDIQSHAWLLTDNNIIIDITGDQFKYDNNFLNYDKFVYVGEMDDFHELFEVETRNCYEHLGINDLGAMYHSRLWGL